MDNQMIKIFFYSIVMLLGTSPVIADEEAPELKDCPRAQMLPKEANGGDRRIACNIPEDLQEQVGLSQYFGGQLRMHDSAAWLTTDSLKEAGAFKAKKLPGPMQGWLTFEEGNSINVRYYAKKENEIVAFARADLDKVSVKAGNNEILKTPIAATEAELAMLAALSAAKSLKLLNCTGPFNSVVLPFSNKNQKEIWVYLFSPWTNKVAPLGGHHLLRYSEDGKNLISQYSQTKGCINNDNTHIDDKSMAALMITHITSDTPTEMHVFMSLQYRKPIYVMTINNGITWLVERNKISVLERRDGKKFFERSTQRAKDK